MTAGGQVAAGGAAADHGRTRSLCGNGASVTRWTAVRLSVRRRLANAFLILAGPCSDIISFKFGDKSNVIRQAVEYKIVDWPSLSVDIPAARSSVQLRTAGQKPRMATRSRLVAAMAVMIRRRPELSQSRRKRDGRRRARARGLRRYRANRVYIETGCVRNDPG